MSKEKEVCCYEPIDVVFKELGYETFRFSISHSGFYIDFTLHNKSVDEIQDILFRFYEAYEIERDEVCYYTSPENLRRINQKTLSSTKTVWELFESRCITIKELT